MNFTEITCSKCRNYLYLIICPAMKSPIERAEGVSMKISPCQTCLEEEYKRGLENLNKRSKKK